METRAWQIRAILLAVLAMFAVGAAEERPNLALKKPAFSSSVENDEHGAAKANDGDLATCWRADDEPEGGPEWWMVDLEDAHDLSGCQIIWPFDHMKYQFKIEGSADRKTWTLLSDQTHNNDQTQVRELKFDHAPHIRFVRVTITAVDEGIWPSISEVKVFGK